MFKKNYLKKLGNILPRRTPKGTIMWVQVPMTADSTDEKTNIIISTINQFGTKYLKLKIMSDQEKKYVHKASSGSLFKNQYKEKDSQP